MENMNPLGVFPLTFFEGFFIWPFNGSAYPSVCEMEKHKLLWRLLGGRTGSVHLDPSRGGLCWGTRCLRGARNFTLCHGWACKSLGFVNFHLESKIFVFFVGFFAKMLYSQSFQ